MKMGGGSPQKFWNGMCCLRLQNDTSFQQFLIEKIYKHLENWPEFSLFNSSFVHQMILSNPLIFIQTEISITTERK